MSALQKQWDEVELGSREVKPHPPITTRCDHEHMRAALYKDSIKQLQRIYCTQGMRANFSTLTTNNEAVCTRTATESATQVS